MQTIKAINSVQRTEQTDNILHQVVVISFLKLKKRKVAPQTITKKKKKPPPIKKSFFSPPKKTVPRHHKRYLKLSITTSLNYKFKT